jgi:serine/threonine protein kinase
MIYRRCMPSIVRFSPSLLNDVRIDRTVKLLGQGTFGKVVEAVDTQTDTRVAIKIIRAIPKYRDASKIEVRVLNKLKERDPLNRQYVYFQYVM